MKIICLYPEFAYNKVLLYHFWMVWWRGEGRTYSKMSSNFIFCPKAWDAASASSFPAAIMGPWYHQRITFAFVSQSYLGLKEFYQLKR
jgi:hypothetical protein